MYLEEEGTETNWVNRDFCGGSVLRHGEGVAVAQGHSDILWLCRLRTETPPRLCPSDLSGVADSPPSSPSKRVPTRGDIVYMQPAGLGDLPKPP